MTDPDFELDEHLARAVLGTAMWADAEPAAAAALDALANPYVREPYRSAFAVMSELAEAGGPMDPLAIWCTARSLGRTIAPGQPHPLTWLHQLHSEAPAGSLAYWSAQLRTLHTRHDIVTAGDRITAAAWGLDPELQLAVIEKTADELVSTLRERLLTA